MTSSAAYQLAERKPGYGPREWVVGKAQSGEYHANPTTAASLKAAMLATGTKGHFHIVGASNATWYYITWSVAVCWFANYQRGFAS